MDWETHPHKPFYVDGSPNHFFILKATLGTHSENMVPNFWIDSEISHVRRCKAIVLSHQLSVFAQYVSKM